MFFLGSVGVVVFTLWRLNVVWLADGLTHWQTKVEKRTSERAPLQLTLAHSHSHILYTVYICVCVESEKSSFSTDSWAALPGHTHEHTLSCYSCTRTTRRRKKKTKMDFGGGRAFPPPPLSLPLEYTVGGSKKIGCRSYKVALKVCVRPCVCVSVSMSSFSWAFPSFFLSLPSSAVFRRGLVGIAPTVATLDVRARSGDRRSPREKPVTFQAVRRLRSEIRGCSQLSSTRAS